MKRQPHGIRFNEIKKVLEHFNYERLAIDGSHHQFRNVENGDKITIVFRKPNVKVDYVKDVLRRIGE